MGNSNNNTVIEYQTKQGLLISYLYWDLKGKNRFPDQPQEYQINMIFDKCLQQIDIPAYQLRTINEFTPKYKYRFVILHRRKVAQAKKQTQIKKLSRQSYHLQYALQARNMQSKNKITGLQNLMKDVQLKQCSLKISLKKVAEFIAQKFAEDQFIQIHGVERFVSFLQKAIKLNNEGTKTSFSSQIQLLKFFSFFSSRYPRQFYAHLSKVSSYPAVLLKSYHPINTQIIAYCLSLLTEYIWKVEDGQNIFRMFQNDKNEKSHQFLLQSVIQSIVQSQSLVSVYHNIKFINELMASATKQQQKQLLHQNLFDLKYTMVLQNVKAKLQGMQYTIQKASFISNYQKIFKYSIMKEQSKYSRPMIDAIIQENYRNSTVRVSINSLPTLHEQTILKMLQMGDQDRLISHQSQLQQKAQAQLMIYLSQNDLRKFTKIVLETLTEMQKFEKLQYYLQDCDQEDLEVQPQKVQEMIDLTINCHNLETFYLRIKQGCSKHQCNQTLKNCFKILQYFDQKQWLSLEKHLLFQNGQSCSLDEEIQVLKKDLQQKQDLIRRLIKQNKESKGKSTDNFQLTQLVLLSPPPSIAQSLNLPKAPSFQHNISVSLPSIPLPPIPVLNILNVGGDSLKPAVKQKQKRRPLKQLKACNYTTIPFQKIRNSVFQQIDDTKVQIDEKQLSELFAKDINKNDTSIRASNLQISQTGSIRLNLPSSSKESVILLSPDRARNVEIVLAKLRIPQGQFAKALFECSGKFTTQNILQSVDKILPNEEQEQMIRAFDGNQQALGISQKFFTELVRVPEYSSRIKALIFSHVREQSCFQIQSKLQCLQKAFTFLKSNDRLKCVLQIGLALGNYLNGQNTKGGAWAFKLQTIQRLQEVKSADNNMNAAIYLIRQAWKQFGYPIFGKEQIESYHYLSKVPTSQVSQELGQLQSFANSIQKALLSKDQNNQNDKVDIFCSNLINDILKKLNQYRVLNENLKKLYIQCAAFYCQDGKSLSSDQFGKKIYRCILFISNTQKIWKVLRQKRSKQENRRAKSNTMSYIGLVDTQNSRQSLICIEEQQSLSKTSLGILTHQKNSSYQNNPSYQRQVSLIFEVPKTSKPLNELTQQQKLKQLKTIQKESLDRALQDVFRRRTMKIQNMNFRLSKVNGGMDFPV